MEEQSPHDAFKHHEIKRQDERSLLLIRPGVDRSSLFCTIAIDDHAQIVVFGDIGPMVFAHHRGTLEARIAWIGSHSQVGYNTWVTEKARIGMSNFRRAMTMATAEDFESDVREALDTVREELYPLDGQPPASNEIARRRRVLTWEAFQRDYDFALWDGDYSPSAAPAQRKLNEYLEANGFPDNWEWVGGLGERPIPEIGLAHAALRRAHLLLKGE